MEVLWLAALAIGPGLVLVHFHWARDREREPLRNLLAYLGLGAASVVPAAFAEAATNRACVALAQGLGTPLALLLHAFLGVALVEEVCKRMLLHTRAHADRHINEPFDWLVYAVTVSLGFATVENLLYVYQHGTATGLVRAVTAVPAHAFFGTIMGWRLARAAERSGADARRERLWAWLEPTLWHGAYDLPLFASRVAQPGLFLTLFPLVLLCLWRVSVRRVETLALAQQHTRPPLLALEALALRARARRRGAAG
ncbi:MAG TPA: PrsW family intramembrane metalloprotease [Planctomycetota bacterium]